MGEHERNIQYQFGKALAGKMQEHQPAEEESGESDDDELESGGQQLEAKIN